VTRSTTWKVWSIDLLINAFAFTTYLKSRGAWNKGQLPKRGVVEKRLKTTVLEYSNCISQRCSQDFEIETKTWLKVKDWDQDFIKKSETKTWKFVDYAEIFPKLFL